jgi:hypothetical protein
METIILGISLSALLISLSAILYAGYVILNRPKPTTITVYDTTYKQMYLQADLELGKTKVNLASTKKSLDKITNELADLRFTLEQYNHHSIEKYKDGLFKG